MFDLKRLIEACESDSYQFITNTREEKWYCIVNCKRFLETVDKDVLSTLQSKDTDVNGNKTYVIPYTLMYNLLTPYEGRV